MEGRLKKYFNTVKESFLDALYPKTCALCGNILLSKERGICRECSKTLRLVEEPRCKKCGKAIRDWQEEFCLDCRKHTHSFVCNRGIFSYNEQMQDAIARWKFQGRREYSQFFGDAMYYYGKSYIKHCEAQVLFSMPIHKDKKKLRGFNQAEDLAKIIEKYTQIPYLGDFLIRKRNTKAMKDLNANERRVNLRGAFDYLGENPGYKRALLIDDIYTTGSSLDEVSKVLKAVGIEEVYTMTLCVGESEK